MVVLLIGTVGAALAGDVETWVGGAVSTGAGVQSDGEKMQAIVPLQAEVDFRAGGAHWFTRVDADVHMLPVGGGGDVLTYPLPVEWAMFQLGNHEDPYRLRLGIHNPNINVEDWDEWLNYLPTFSMVFNGASPGRILGGEVAYHMGDGTEIFAWGGGDADFYGYTFEEDGFADVFIPTFGVGVSSEQESWSTWTGFAAYPGEPYYGVFGAFEVYPADALWVTLDGGAGLSYGAPFAGAQLVFNVFPEALVAPVARVEAMFDPDDAALGGAAEGVYDGTASLGARYAPTAPLMLQAEAKLTFEGNNVYPGAYLLVTAAIPEPSYYAVSDPEE